MQDRKRGELAIRDASVKEKTGKSWAEWFAILDEWGAVDKGHKLTARYLEETWKLSPWWSQTVTIRHEQERGARQVGQRSGGKFTVSLQRTIGVDIERAYLALTEPALLSQWFTKEARADLNVGGSYSNADGDRGTFLALDRPNRIRYTWENPVHCPGTLVEFSLAYKPGGKVTIQLEHSRIEDEAGYRDMKEGWAWAMDSLKSFLETGKPIPHP